ncbi:hypothetical protein HNQ80_004850 [Anaerosolibacter carboniphilus]|uniref:Uncharacterized protein n=1 Tax=Anaerosolibacter carboniphilus TaxID=1417629 RepID=A0A841KY36_9FIRM|nr:hypothetical protein [Anaerosolibacter carboniphilus]MBB6218676.1 hypothetical protein [Anaerosolibacter carboniphilus]
MEKHRSRVKFKDGKIVCASEIRCSSCADKYTCEAIDLFIEAKYEGIRDCMSHDSHRREKGKIKQKRWGTK